MIEFVSLDEALESDYLSDMKLNSYEEGEYCEDPCVSDALDTFLREVCHEEPEDEHQRMCGIW